jgi:hypothetical protein
MFSRPLNRLQAGQVILWLACRLLLRYDTGIVRSYTWAGRTTMNENICVHQRSSASYFQRRPHAPAAHNHE